MVGFSPFSSLCVLYAPMIYFTHVKYSKLYFTLKEGNTCMLWVAISSNWHACPKATQMLVALLGIIVCLLVFGHSVYLLGVDT